MRARAWFYVYRSAAAICGVLPLRQASRIGDLLGRLAFHTSQRTRRNVENNLRHVLNRFGSAPVPTGLVRASFRSYGRYWTELACLAHDRKKLGQARYEFIGEQHVRSALAEGRGVIVALPHIGAWDIAGALFVRNGMALTTVAEGAVSSVLFNWFVKKRADLGLSVLNLDNEAGPRLLSVLKAGGFVTLVADRDVVGDGLEVQFFGAWTRVPPGPAVLALRSGAMLFVAAAFQNGFGGYRIVILPAIDTSRQGSFREDVLRVTTDVVAKFEMFITEAPDQWHVFQRNWTESGRSRAEEDFATRVGY